MKMESSRKTEKECGNNRSSRSRLMISLALGSSTDRTGQSVSVPNPRPMAKTIHKVPKPVCKSSAASAPTLKPSSKCSGGQSVSMPNPQPMAKTFHNVQVSKPVRKASAASDSTLKPGPKYAGGLLTAFPKNKVNTNSKVSTWLASNQDEDDNTSVLSSEAPSLAPPPQWFSNLFDEGHLITEKDLNIEECAGLPLNENESIDTLMNAPGAKTNNVHAVSSTITGRAPLLEVQTNHHHETSVCDLGAESNSNRIDTMFNRRNQATDLTGVQQQQLQVLNLQNQDPADVHNHEPASQIIQTKSVTFPKRATSKGKEGVQQRQQQQLQVLNGQNEVSADVPDCEPASQIIQTKSVIFPQRAALKEKEGVHKACDVRDNAKRKLCFRHDNGTSVPHRTGSNDSPPPTISDETRHISISNVSSEDNADDTFLDTFLNSPLSLDSELAFDFEQSPSHGPQSNRSLSRVVMVSKGDDDMLPTFYEEETSVELDMPDNVSQEINETVSTSDICATPEQRIPISNSTPSNALPISTVTPETSTSNTSSSSSNSRKRKVVPPRENTRKRSRCPARWKKIQAKEAFNSGIEHVSSHGKQKKARKLRPGCRLNCRKCSRRVSREEREAIFNHFWKKLKNINSKRSYISSRISVRPPATCHTLPERARSSVRTYYLSVGKERVKVCKKMFLDTLGVPDCWVETSLKKTKNNTDVTSPDKRGIHINRPHRSTAHAIASVIRHIKLFPTVPSHYTRERSKRNYLEPEVKSIERMYRLYCKWANQNNVPKKASLGLYRKTFNTQFNLGFFMPRKDQCELCNRWKTAKNHDERRAMLTEWARHLESRKLVKKLKSEDKASASESKCVACFDLQKVLNCPHSQTSLCFYKNKLSLYNFTVFDLRLKEGHCYIWTEVDAQKGSNEIGTNVFRFIKLKVSEGITEFVFWSDAPTSQNRNRMVFSMFMQAAARFKIKITHRFLESGHSYSEADSMHSVIEREANMKEIYTPKQWISLISNARQDGRSYKVNKLENEEVLDLHSLVNKQVWDRDTRGKQVFWSEVREIVADHKKPNELLYRCSFSEPLKRVKIIMKKDQDDVDLATYQPPQAYHSRFPLSALKFKHLEKLLEKKVVPTKYHPEFQEYMSVGK